MIGQKNGYPNTDNEPEHLNTYILYVVSCSVGIAEGKCMGTTLTILITTIVPVLNTNEEKMVAVS